MSENTFSIISNYHDLYALNLFTTFKIFITKSLVAKTKCNIHYTLFQLKQMIEWYKLTSVYWLRRNDHLTSVELFINMPSSASSPASGATEEIHENS